MKLIKLKWFKEASQDYGSLDGHQKMHIDKGLERIRTRGMESGKQLNGNLIGCREIKNKREGLRIIFKEGDSDDEIEIIDIITIGKREDKKVFKEAHKRLS